MSDCNTQPPEGDDQQQPFSRHPSWPQQPPMPPQYGYGYPPQQFGHAAPRLPIDGLGLTGMILGVATVGLFLWLIPIGGLVPPLVAVPLAAVGLRRCMRHTRRSKGFAITGLVTGIIGLGLAVLWTVGVFSAGEELDDYSDCVDRANTVREMERCG